MRPRLPSLTSLSSQPQSVGAECLEILRGLQNTVERKNKEEENIKPVRQQTKHTGCDRSDISDESPPASRRAALIAALVDDFARHGAVHEVRVPGIPETLFVAPNAEVAASLTVNEKISRGRIWTAGELADLLATSATPADFAAVALVKLAFNGDVVETRPWRPA